MTSNSQRTSRDRLDSWEEIAAYLRRGVRTVQRWERGEGLPVHRHGHGKQSSVYAYPSELDDWWHQRGDAPARGATIFRRRVDADGGRFLEAERTTLRSPSDRRDQLPVARRRVTVLHASLMRGMRARTERDPEELHRAAEERSTLFANAIHRYDGTVARFEDRGVLAVFGVPVTLEDGARRAVAAAMELLELLGPAEGDVRIGIDTGPVVAGRVGDARHSELRLTGEAPLVAKALEMHAPSGEILVSESAFLAVRGYFSGEPVGELEVPEANRSVAAFRITEELPARRRFDLARSRGLTTFVGRSQELRWLEDQVGRAAGGRGRVLFVSGSPGIGKSRLVLELRARVGERVRRGSKKRS